MPAPGCERWVESLGFPKAGEGWRPWMAGGIVAGGVIEAEPVGLSQEQIARTTGTTMSYAETDLAIVAGLNRECRRAVWMYAPIDNPRFAVEDCVASVERLRWARANNCPWTEATMRHVVTRGSLAALQFAIQYGCPMYAEILVDAAMSAARARADDKEESKNIALFLQHMVMFN